MCGTKAESVPLTDPDLEINWNTKDFPKPKKEVRDVPLQWSNPDVSEGYVAVPGEIQRPKAPEEKKVYSAKSGNEEFQKLLDREYERLKAIQRGSQEVPEPPKETSFFRGFDNTDPERERVGADRPYQEEKRSEETQEDRKVQVGKDGFVIPGFLRKGEQEFLRRNGVAIMVNKRV